MSKAANMRGPPATANSVGDSSTYATSSNDGKFIITDDAYIQLPSGEGDTMYPVPEYTPLINDEFTPGVGGSKVSRIRTVGIKYDDGTTFACFPLTDMMLQHRDTVEVVRTNGTGADKWDSAYGRDYVCMGVMTPMHDDIFKRVKSAASKHRTLCKFQISCDVISERDGYSWTNAKTRALTMDTARTNNGDVRVGSVVTMMKAMGKHLCVDGMFLVRLMVTRNPNIAKMTYMLLDCDITDAVAESMGPPPLGAENDGMVATTRVMPDDMFAELVAGLEGTTVEDREGDSKVATESATPNVDTETV